ncbi:hypothetical protein IWQ61_001798 [Dispira simplex]|nr:hypothetical protein IWQ61_001798 [Dispira simplex]
MAMVMEVTDMVPTPHHFSPDPPITEALLSPPNGRTATPAARNLADALIAAHDATMSHDATLFHEARLRGYSSNLALSHLHLPPEESRQPTLLYLHDWASLRSTRLFFYPISPPLQTQNTRYQTQVTSAYPSSTSPPGGKKSTTSQSHPSTVPSYGTSS